MNLLQQQSAFELVSEFKLSESMWKSPKVSEVFAASVKSEW